LAIVQEIELTLATIRRIQSYKTQACNLVVTALIAVHIGITSFISRAGFATMSRSHSNGCNEGYPEATGGWQG
jgi:hypothetical protein